MNNKTKQENIRIDIAYTARYLSGISPKLEMHKTLTLKLENLRKELNKLKKEANNK